MLLALVLACAAPPPADAGGPVDDTGGPDAPTWNGEVAALVGARCASCHAAESSAPMALDTYADAAQWALPSALAAHARSMPPYNEDNSGDCQTFTDARWLSDDEIATLTAWADAGAPLGPGEAVTAQAPAAPTLAEVDAVLEVGGTVEVETSAEAWRCYLVELDAVQDPWLVGYRMVPADPSIVHHATVYSLPDPLSAQDAHALDAADEGAGYACPDGVMVDTFKVLALYNPGTPATRHPAGTGVKVSVEEPALVRVHYTGSGTGAVDIELDLAPEVEIEATPIGLSIDRFELEPGLAEVEIDLDLALPGGPAGEVVLYGVNPHMHAYATSQRLVLDPDGEAQCLSWTPRFDPDWQQLHWYETPLALREGDPVRLSCTYDTTSAPGPLYFGQSYDDEMCVVQLYAALR